MGFIPDDWLQSLDYSTLEKMPGSYISEDFKQREDDIVWRVKVGGDWVYLYLLHQCSHIPAYPRTNRAMSARIRSNKDVPVIIAF